MRTGTRRVTGPALRWLALAALVLVQVVATSAAARADDSGPGAIAVRAEIQFGCDGVLVTLRNDGADPVDVTVSWGTAPAETRTVAPQGREDLRLDDGRQGERPVGVSVAGTELADEARQVAVARCTAPPEAVLEPDECAGEVLVTLRGATSWTAVEYYLSVPGEPQDRYLPAGPLADRRLVVPALSGQTVTVWSPGGSDPVAHVVVPECAVPATPSRPPVPPVPSAPTVTGAPSVLSAPEPASPGPAPEPAGPAAAPGAPVAPGSVAPGSVAPGPAVPGPTATAPPAPAALAPADETPAAPPEPGVVPSTRVEAAPDADGPGVSSTGPRDTTADDAGRPTRDLGTTGAAPASAAPTAADGIPLMAGGTGLVVLVTGGGLRLALRSRQG